jgi:septum formation protein
LTRLILASASATRAQILERAGVAFAVHPAAVDEETVKSSSAGGHAVAEMLAEMKALRVSASHADALVLGADQVLICQGRVLSKAASLEDAREQLRFLRGKRHLLVSALVLARAGVSIWRHGDEASLWVREFSDVFLENYLQAEGREVLGSVGCYRLEGMGVQLFERVEGDYFSILGLPLMPLLAALREHGAVER